MPRYKVIVDDNFHYQDPHERREQGVYETVEEALAVCRGLVDKSLKEEYRSGISAKSLTLVTPALAMIRPSWCSTVRMTVQYSQPGITRKSAAP
jgi:hypothetical protein